MHRGLNLSTHDLVRWSVYGLILVVPFVTHLAGFIGLGAWFDTPNVILPIGMIRGVTLVIVAIWGLQVFAQGEILYRRSPLNSWLAIYGITLIVATLASSHSWADFFGEQGQLRGLITLLNFLFIAGVVLNFFQKKEEVYNALKVGGAVVVVAAIAKGMVEPFTTEAANRSGVELVLHGFLVLIWGSLVWKTLFSRAVQKSVKAVTLALFGIGVTYEISEIILGANLVGEALFFIFLGLAVSYYHITVDPTPQSRQFKSIPLIRIAKLAFTLAILGLWLLSAWFTFRQTFADYALEQGDIARRENNGQTMLNQYQRATQLIPWMPELWERYGDGVHELANRDNPPEIAQPLLETAIHAYELADLRRGGDSALLAKTGETYLDYANILGERGRYGKAEEAKINAITLYREAMETGEEDPKFAYAYGKLLLQEKRYDEAEEIFKKVLSLRDPYEDVHYRLALVATELKNYDEARAHIQLALRENGGDENVKALLQRINQETKQ